ncbi:hypothetical protein CLV59_11418 [Chitinophaga dinghuensis]|uniref:Uncharacterized protein n=1 Tax=Chitinophaga dinghuensis TaxID=1539050 RepID=A0A327VRW5_9BACT|nr:hypothetical protein CLV59_11418 [Chitinophaga dinghuensis]
MVYHIGNSLSACSHCALSPLKERSTTLVIPCRLALTARYHPSKNGLPHWQFLVGLLSPRVITPRERSTVFSIPCWLALTARYHPSKNGLPHLQFLSACSHCALSPPKTGLPHTQFLVGLLSPRVITPKDWSITFAIPCRLALTACYHPQSTVYHIRNFLSACSHRVLSPPKDGLRHTQFLVGLLSLRVIALKNVQSHSNFIGGASPPRVSAHKKRDAEGIPFFVRHPLKS